MSKPDGENMAGVQKGQVVVLMLLLGMGGVVLWRYLQDEPLWQSRLILPSPSTAPAERLPAPPKPKPASLPGPGPDGGSSEQRLVLPPDPHFADPQRAMHHFFDRLAALEAGRLRRPVRTLFYGTSEIGFDRVTSQMRRRLQDRFGDGGKGFVPIAPGWRYQRHQDVVWRTGPDWKVFTVRAHRREDGRYGLGGVLAVNRGPAWVAYRTVSEDKPVRGYHPLRAGTRFSKFQLYYGTAPRGGRLQIRFDGGKSKARLDTSSPDPEDKVLTRYLEDGPHRVRIQTGQRTSRLYGVVFERKRGLVLDALIIIGMWGHSMLHFDPDHIRHQVQLRRPDLVIFQLGAKEVFRNPNLGEEKARAFAEGFTASVKRIMAGRPAASCLIVSTKDMGFRRRGRIVTRPAVKRVVRGAGEAARRTGCAFYNLFQAMGGENTMADWATHDPRLVSPDLGHLMDPGAIRVGDLITDALLHEYGRFRTRAEQEGQRQARE